MQNQTNNFFEKSLNTAILFLRWVSLIIIVGLLFSGVTFVQPSEVALILRFGKLVGNTPAEQIHQPGLLFAFPYLVDQVIRLSAKRVQEVVIDGLYSYEEIGNVINSGYALTGDENIVFVNAIIKYQITDPIKYGLQVDEPKEILRGLITSSLTENITCLSVDYVLAEGKKELANMVLQDSQQLVDGIDLGIQLIALEFTSLQPPEEVKKEFDLVTSTYVEKETMLKEAYGYKEQRIPYAIADRNAMIQSATARKVERIAQAKLNVAQFYGLLEEYEKNPEMIRQRIYLEKTEKIIQQVADRIFLPGEGSGVKIILPFISNDGRDQQ
ncbi:MAG: FtsH protease activity modulator HflK [Halanaerobiales bacterium]|nr:FtsH protease activity modulator HflK [Halanaerobiales bacterium]